MADLLITHGRLITWGSPNEIMEDGALLVRDGVIMAIGPSAELEAAHPAVERLDARDQLVMPGNICAHTHFYSALARGMAIPGRAPREVPPRYPSASPTRTASSSVSMPPPL